MKEILRVLRNQEKNTEKSEDVFKDDLWGALEEYPEARKNLLEKGRQMLMKVKLQYLSHADEGEGWFSSILIIFYQEKMKKSSKSRMFAKLKQSKSILVLGSFDTYFFTFS